MPDSFTSIQKLTSQLQRMETLFGNLSVRKNIVVLFAAALNGAHSSTKVCSGKKMSAHRVHKAVQDTLSKCGVHLRQRPVDS